MTNRVGDKIVFDDTEFIIVQISQHPKDKTLKVVLQEPAPQQ